MLNVNIGTRLALAFAMVLTLTVAMTVAGVWRLHAVIVAVENMDEATMKERLSQEWLGAIVANSVRTFSKAKSTDAADQKYFQDEMDANSAGMTTMQKTLEEHVSSENGKRLLAIVADKRKQYVSLRKDSFAFKAAMKPGDEAEFKSRIDTKLVPAMNAYIASVHDVVDYQKGMFAAARTDADVLYVSGRMLLIALGVASLTLGCMLAWLLSRSITRPLRYAVSVATTVAAGDLSSSIVVSSTDETGQLLQALKEMNGQLLGIVGQVQAGTETIATASRQIASGNLDLSSRTEVQASSLEETASSMEELTSTVKQNADNARQANVLAVSASDTATTGGKVVAEVVDTMRAISASSRKVVDIIAVIDGIAFQTNILALNAAVEAARAGEQGRGFAVVASEVRNLAQRSAGAAKEIKTLIGDSVAMVDVGARQVDQAGATMEEIVASVKRVTDIMSEIALASQEQTSGIEQINQAITQMDEVTQQNAALVEQAAAAAESLQDQASHLAQVVSVFKTAAVRSAVVPAAASSPRRAVPVSVRARVPAVARPRSPAVPSNAVAVARTRLPAAAAAGDDWEEF